MAKRRTSRKVHKASAKRSSDKAGAKRSSDKAGAKRSSGKGQIPLKKRLPLSLLEKRLKTLYSIVDERGGNLPDE